MKELRIGTYNVRSIRTRERQKSVLEVLNSVVKTDITVLTETWLERSLVH